MINAKLYWVHDTRWETETQLIARLTQLPRGLTLHQIAVKAGISKADRNPRNFSALLKKHHITWVLEDIDARMAVPYDFWLFDEIAMVREADTARRQAIAVAKAQLKSGKARVYRGCWA